MPREQGRYVPWFTISPIANSQRKSVSCVFMTRRGHQCLGFVKQWKQLKVTEMNNHLDNHHLDDIAVATRQQSVANMFGATIPHTRMQYPEQLRYVTTQMEAYKVIRGNVPFSHLNSTWYWAPQRLAWINYPKFARVRFSDTILPQMYNAKLQKVKYELRDANDFELSLQIDGYDSKKKKILNALIVIFVNLENAVYQYKALPFSSVQSENSDAVVAFIQEVLNDIGPSKFSTIITDNASTMTSAWRKLTDDTTTCGNLKHLLFMSFACHMIHNYIKEVLKDTLFKDCFEMVKLCIQLCRQKEFRVYICHKYRLPKWFVPSYTTIRWGSASEMVGNDRWLMTSQLVISQLVEKFQVTSSRLVND